VIVRMQTAPVGGYVSLFILLVVIGIGLLLYFRNARLDFGDGQISRTNLFGQTKTWALSDVGTVLAVRSLVAFMQPPSDNLFVLDTAGRTIIRASDQRWAPSQMRALVDAIGHTPVILDHPVRAKAVRSDYPGAVSWTEAHPAAVAFLSVGAFLLLFVGVLVVFAV
jgi:hypothetical protein